MTQDEFDRWAGCAVEGCRNKSCRALGSRYCYPHTMGQRATLGYKMRDTPTIVEELSMYQPPKRKSYNDCYAQWQANMRKLSGQTDVSLEGVEAQVEQSFANEYAAAECADGRAREQLPGEIND
jgi:hypothetical protein